MDYTYFMSEQGGESIEDVSTDSSYLFTSSVSTKSSSKRTTAVSRFDFMGEDELASEIECIHRELREHSEDTVEYNTPFL